MAVCTACGAPMRWAYTENGKRIPLDIDPNTGELATVNNGNLALTGEDRTVAGQTLPVVAYVKAGTGPHITHFATCPAADRFRKTRRGRT